MWLKKWLICLILWSTLVLTWCTKPVPTINSWDKVAVDYTLSREDGEVIASNIPNALVVTTGSTALASVFEGRVTAWDKKSLIGEKLIGLELGKEITGEITPQQSRKAKDYDTYRLQGVPLKVFEYKEVTPVIGQPYATTSDEGIIRSIKGDIVEVDYNPRSTRQNIRYTIKVREIKTLQEK